MKTYPTISRETRYGRDWFVYDKLDGQNIRAEWSKKKGFYKFGSRKVLLPDEDAVHVMSCVAQLESVFEKVFKKQRVDRAVCFFEWFGANSFAGMHASGDDMKVSLLDVWISPSGMLDPRDYEKWFRGKVPMPTLLCRGFNKEKEQEVRDGALAGMTFEGVVVKGFKPRKGDVRPMFKCKNTAWLTRLKEQLPDQFEQLS